jgi:catechol 2,3-dioxygenase-like lactoylglutathione lyase family enzyme
MIDHVSLQVTEADRSRRFYDRILAPLGLHPAYADGAATGYADPTGRAPFWIVPTADTAASRELHIAFRAPHRRAVEEVYGAATDIGAEILHAPRTFPEYNPDYYACFVRDPDGHNIEAVFRDAPRRGA